MNSLLSKETTLTKALILLFAGVYFFNVLCQLTGDSGMRILAAFSLDVNATVRSFQLWRVVTYPFNIAYPEQYIFFAVSIMCFGLELERTIGRRAFALLLGLLTVLQAILFLLASVTNPATGETLRLVGPTSLGFFVTAVLLMVYPNSNLKIIGGTSKIRSLSVALFLVVSIVTITSVRAAFHQISYLEFISFSGSSAFGIVTGLVVGFSWRRAWYKSNDTFQTYESNQSVFSENDFEPIHEHLGSSFGVSSRLKKMEKQFIDEAPVDYNEETLNTVLDKMLDQGFDSLNRAEKQFLDEYSKRLS